MKIFHDSAEVVDIIPTDESYRYRAVKSDHSLTLYYSLPEHIEIPVGAYCYFQGQTYVLNDRENLKKIHTRNFEYTLIMDSAQANLKKYKLRDLTGRLKFPMTARPQEFLQLIVDNMNQRESGWTAGMYVDAAEKVIAFNHIYLLDALNTVADEFETEWEVNGKEISLRRVEYNKSTPLAVSYGKGNGFKSGVGRQTEGKAIEVLYVQGGSKNIDPSKYGGPDLLLPKSQTLTYEGRTYQTDADGTYIKRSDKDLTSGNEDSLDLSNIYPSRVGEVTGVTMVNAGENLYDIIDSSIPAELDYEACLTEGEKMTIIFQSGMLTGKEFEAKYIHADKRFEIVPQEVDGQTMPGGSYLPVIGDKYAVFGIQLPDAYVSDNSTLTGASWDMFREAVKYLYDHEEENFTFTGELDGIWAKTNWLTIGAKIIPGGYVSFSDDQFAPDGVLIRITGVKDYVNRPYSPVLELSNSTAGTNLGSDLKKIDSNEVIAGEMANSVRRYTKRRFRDAEETISMLQDAMLNGFSDSISPLTIHTMALLVGDESLQFRFVDDTVTPVQVPDGITYDGDTKVLDCPSGVIQHMSIGITQISSEHAVTEYKFWTMSAYTTPPLTESAKKYYLYAKVSKTATTGIFVLSETAIAMESVAGYYHLLIGLLGSEYDADRSFVTLYGFTEILPGRITTEKIVSPDGETYFDIANGVIGGRLKFVSSGVEKDVATEIGDAKDTADTAQAIAISAQSDANQAAIDAAAATALLADMTNDDKLTADEKQSLSLELFRVNGEYPRIVAQAVAAGVSHTDYDLYYGYITDYIDDNDLLDDLTTTSTVDGALLRAYFSYYNQEKYTLLKNVSAKIGQDASDAATAADAANLAADAANGKVDNLKVGGQNLIRQSNVFKQVSGSGFLPGWWLEDIYFNEQVVLTIWTGDGVANNAAIGFATNGTWSGSYFDYPSLSPNSVYQKVLTLNKSSYNQLALFVNDTTSILRIKLERGNKGTDWTPAESDKKEGGRNLLRLSDEDVSNTANPIKTWDMVAPMVLNRIYTFSVKGINESSGTGNWVLYLSGTVIELAKFKKDNNGVASISFIGKSSGLTEDEIRLYSESHNSAYTNSVEWVKLEEGANATGWAAAKEDFQDYMESFEAAVDEVAAKTNNMILFDGGVALANVLMVGDGINIGGGLSGVDASNGNAIWLWGGASYTDRDTAPFRVDRSGKMFATGVEISGKISANEGDIGDWSIVGGGLSNRGSNDWYGINSFTEINPSGDFFFKSFSIHPTYPDTVGDEGAVAFSSTNGGSLPGIGFAYGYSMRRMHRQGSLLSNPTLTLSFDRIDNNGDSLGITSSDYALRVYGNVSLNEIRNSANTANVSGTVRVMNSGGVNYLVLV